jgi:hypothetical protein
MRALAPLALTLLGTSLAACTSTAPVPAGLVLTWNVNGTSGNQYQTLHLGANVSAQITVSQDSTRRNFTVFLSGGPPNGTAPGSGPATPSSTCTAFTVDANATTAQLEHDVTAVGSGTCYLVAYDTDLAYTQLLLANP